MRVKIFRFLLKNFQISLEKFSDFSGKIFRFLWKNFQISPEKFSDFSWKIFRFLLKNFQISLEKFSDFSGKIFRFLLKNFQISPGKFSDFSWKIFRFLLENFQISPEKFSDLSEKLFQICRGNIFRFVGENFQICPGKFIYLSLTTTTNSISPETSSSIFDYLKGSGAFEAPCQTKEEFSANDTSRHPKVFKLRPYSCFWSLGAIWQPLWLKNSHDMAIFPHFFTSSVTFLVA